MFDEKKAFFREEEDAERLPQEVINDGKIFAILAYLPPFLFLISIIMRNKNPFAMYHARQGMVLQYVWLFSDFIILMLLILMVPFAFGQNVAYMFYLAAVAWNVLIILSVILGISNAGREIMRPLPFIGEIAKHFNL